MAKSESIPADLLDRAAQVFGNERKARRWLTRPHALLDDRTPVDAAQTEHGREKVDGILGRIEHGVYG